MTDLNIIKPILIILLLITALIALFTIQGSAQYVPPVFKKNKMGIRRPVRLNDSTFLDVRVYGGTCKFNTANFNIIESRTDIAEKNASPEFLLTHAKDFVHGDIVYDYFYRSAMDTPYVGENIQQHSIRANIQLMLARNLPVLVQLNSRQTNSPLFKNYTDANIQFNSQVYNSATRDKLLRAVVQKIIIRSPDSLLLKALNERQNLLNQDAQWLEGPKQIQRLVESRQIINRCEDLLRNKLPDSADHNSTTGMYAQAQQLIGRSAKIHVPTQIPGSSINHFVSSNKDLYAQKVTDSLENAGRRASGFIQLYKEKEQQYNSRKKSIDSLLEVYKTAKAGTEKKIEAVKNIFANGNSEEIAKKVREYKLDSSSVFKWYRALNAVKQFSIGRSMVDYSELSARNISITGLQAVYNSNLYLAFATGTVDYQYRDFIFRNYSPVKQYLNLARLGIGPAEAHNLIFSIFQGKKQANYFSSASQPAVNKVFGITLQGKFRLNENSYVLAEAGKSSYPQTAVAGTGNKTFNFSNHSNEAYSLQLFSRIVRTDTRIYGQYKHLGRNYQSFSIFNVNSDFTAWQARLDQYFFKKRLFVTAGLRTSDYNNPYLANTVKSNTVFKSVQATLRLRKWPVLSLGYMPSSQVTSLNNQVFENRFYTLTASGNYSYRINHGYIHTGLIYTKFYNDTPDSAFVYYNAKNWFFYHHIIGNKITFNSFVTLGYNTGYRLLTIDQGLSYRLSQQLTAGGGVKWNRLNQLSNHTGYYGNIQLRVSKLGEFNFSFDRGFIPGVKEDFRKNDFGRATYIKTF